MSAPRAAQRDGARLVDDGVRAVRDPEAVPLGPDDVPERARVPARAPARRT
ncbi:hypothetical protein [Streptomyces flavofungini]|uniref:hypothetical protein n=1 Tax=Streptomyces flavofungini TaxID=68200 RepID=UPI0025B09ADC|nr:hypothetical protein [Streptomyces flavofungini]WJV45168.1 hypothetical protein QUY26_06205 [Streptomyces flavofungini]